MPKFRKKPVVIEAVQFIATDEMHRLGWWDAHGASFDIHVDGRGPYLVIPTREGEMVASDGDWIIRGIKGEFYPCKPDIFEATYERVE